MYIHMVMSQRMLVTACPLHTLVRFNTTKAFVALYIALYMTVTRVELNKAIEEVNQTVKIVFEQSLSMHLSPVHT